MICQSIQATAVCFKKKAILIQGPSGVGKTALALRIIDRGGTLLGDDLVDVFVKKDTLYCKGKQRLKGVVEIKGLGLVCGLKTAKACPVLCVIRLHNKKTDRLPSAHYITLCNKKIPVFDFYACEMNDIQVLYVVDILKGRYSLLKEM